MKLIKPSFEILEQGSGLEGVYKQIELAGRTCYKSEDKITECSAKKFVDMMIKSGHGAMLEHGTVYLDLPNSARDFDAIVDYWGNKYSKCRTFHGDDRIHNYVTTNLRVLVENGWLDDLKYICEPTEFHEKRVTVKFTCDIGITREFNRHRVNSIAEQSTRYCNYTKDKFDNEIAFVPPLALDKAEIERCKKGWIDEDASDMDVFRSMCRTLSRYEDTNEIETWLFGCLASEYCYKRLVKLGWKPQEARGKLEIDTASELIHTAFVSDWKHFFELRDDAHAHPQAQELAHPLHEEFIKRKYLTK